MYKELKSSHSEDSPRGLQLGAQGGIMGVAAESHGVTGRIKDTDTYKTVCMVSGSWSSSVSHL